MSNYFKLGSWMMALAATALFTGASLAEKPHSPLLESHILADQPETLEHAWCEALANAHRLKASRQTAQSARETLSSARAAYLPTITAEGGHFWLDQAPGGVVTLPGMSGLPITIPGLPVTLDNQFSAGRVVAAIPLFTSGRIASGVAAAKAGWRATQADERQEALDLKMNVAAAYLNVLRASRAVRVATSHVTSLASHCRNVADFQAQGLVSRNDALASEVALADARQQAIQADNALDLARANFNRLLVRPLIQPVILAEMQPPPPAADVERLTRCALQQRPELAAYGERAIALRKEARGVRASALPSVSVAGSYNRIDSGFLDRNHFDNDFWMVGIVGSWNVFDSGLTQHKARAVDDKATAMESMRAEAADTVALQVRQAWLNVHESLHRLDVTGRAIQQGEENLRVARDRYREGTGTNTEVLDAETLRVRTLSNNNIAIDDAIFAAIALHRAVGDL